MGRHKKNREANIVETPELIEDNDCSSCLLSAVVPMSEEDNIVTVEVLRGHRVIEGGGIYNARQRFQTTKKRAYQMKSSVFIVRDSEIEANRENAMNTFTR